MDKGKLGVIGGMGPQATLQFCQRVIDLTAAQTDQEHIPTLILNDTEMPDRTEAILSGKGDGRLDPAGPATRAEAAVMTRNLIGLMVSQNSQT